MKSESRVMGYKKGTEDWDAEYNMLLDDDVTCESCIHAYRCCSMFGTESTDTSCGFYPNKFVQRQDNQLRRL